jgi:hypothetical protein
VLQQAIGALAVTLRGDHEELEGVRDPVNRVEQEADVERVDHASMLTPASRSGATSAAPRSSGWSVIVSSTASAARTLASTGVASTRRLLSSKVRTAFDVIRPSCIGVLNLGSQRPLRRTTRRQPKRGWAPVVPAAADSMAAMAEVEWEKLSASSYEDMVSVLLSHMNPEVRRIDGSGGDGGRDAEFPRDDGHEIYQLKKFTGRMNGGRRGQVKSSLNKAAKRNPVAWHLVVPIDHTPKELEWFETLQREYDFPLYWDGRTWLNTQMAERPFIPRYFLTDERDRVLDLIAQLNEEHATLEDLQTGVERMRALAATINELDPYYRFDIAVRGDKVQVSPQPRYEGAELDRPITINMNLAFPNTEEGRAALGEFQRAMDYGTPVEVEGQFVKAFTIDGPAGFGGTFNEGSFKIGPPEPQEKIELGFELRALNGDGVAVATLPITLTERTVGLRGAIVRGSDRPGAFAVEMRANAETRLLNLNFKFSASAEHLPHDLLPALAFMQAMVPPNSVEVLVGPDRIQLGPPVTVPDVVPMEERYVRLVTDLASLQRETNTYFAMPALFSPEDLHEIAEGLELLDGKEVELPWKKAQFELNVTDPKRFLAELEDKADGMAFFVDGPGQATIAGHTLPLGKMRTFSPAARVTNPDEVRAALRGADDDDGPIVRVELEALDEGAFKLKLLPD